MKVHILSIIAVGLLLSQSTTHADQASEALAKVVKSLQGEWQLESIEVNGEKKMADEIMQLIRWEIKDNSLTSIKPNADGTQIVEPATFKLDLGKVPKHFDLISLEGATKGKTQKCICSLEKDKLTLAMPPLDGKRPLRFSTDKDNGGGEVVIVLRRVK